MKNRIFKGCKGIIICILFVSVILPLINLLTNINVGDINELVKSPQFFPMLANSLISTISATLLSVTIAFGLAWCVNRTAIRWTTVLSILFTMPMLIPSISHGMGLVLIFGSNGIFTNLTGININLYGFTGIIIGSVLYSFPVAFLMLTDAFKYEDYTIYEAAEVLGLSKWQQFKTVTLSNLKSPIISSIFAVFTMIFTDYGVPLVVGGKIMTLPVYMYREVIGLMDYSKGAIIGVILLIPAFIEFIMDVRKSETGNTSTVVKPYKVPINKKRDRIAYFCCFFTLFLISLPLLTFLILSFVESYPHNMSLSMTNIKKAFDLGLGMYLENSIAISLATALFGLAITYFTAYITARSEKSFSNMVLHLISLVSLAIPGVVLGLCYVLFFHKSFIYGTVIILILVNITHFFASPYLMAYNSLKKFNPNFEDVAVTLGINKMRMLFDVYIKSTRDTMIEIFSYLFVNSMVTISAVSFLANFRNMPLSMLIPQFDSQSLIEATAFISVVIFVINAILKGIIYIAKRYLRKREY